MPFLHEEPRIAEGIDVLTRNDPEFAKLPAYQGDMWPRLTPGFPGLARIVLGQQVSIRAANALWVKLNALLHPNLTSPLLNPSPRAGEGNDASSRRSEVKADVSGMGGGEVALTPSSFLAFSPDALRSAGLSRQKILYLTGLAEAMESGAFKPALFDGMSDDDVTREITALKGFGPWSAQMYLMFALARPDVWSPADLGIQEGLRKYLNAEKRPSADETAKCKAHFSPHCTAASLLLWYLNDQKSGV